uniref:Guanine nucleotide-binding protein subunit gamma n=1 Tax=Sphenodon punctatus TaxID=8508 RepID=A0A8D0GHI9_SPHPU
MAQDMTEKELLKMELDQLKKEVKTERQMISKTGKELKEYIESMAGEDPLIKGIPEDKNPFKEKGEYYETIYFKLSWGRGPCNSPVSSTPMFNVL